MNHLVRGWLTGMLVGVMTLGAWSPVATAAEFSLVPPSKTARDVTKDMARGYQSPAKKKAVGAVGKIVRDSYVGVTIRTPGGQEVEIYRPLVMEQYFASADNERYIPAMKAYLEGNWRPAITLFAQSAKSVSKMAPDDQKMFLQHVYYYTGRCFEELGDYDKAIANYDKALRDQNGAFFFEANLGKARAQEERGDYTGAATLFSRLASTDFPQKKARAPWYVVFVFQAEFSSLRSQMKAAFRNKNSANAERVIEELDKLLASNQKYVTPEIKTEALRIRASGLKLAQKWDDLLALLDKPIKEAVNTNDRKSLAGMYLDRADAMYGKIDAVKDDPEALLEAKKRARFEYLRVTLLTTPPKPDEARALYRLGRLFMDLKGEDWYRRARTHLQRAKVLKDRTWEAKATEALKELKEMKPDASAEKAEDAKEDAPEKKDGEKAKADDEKEG